MQDTPRSGLQIFKFIVWRTSHIRKPLAEMLIKQHEQNKDIGEADFLNAYAVSRKKDHDWTIGFTDTLVRIFANEWVALAAARNIGLALLDHIPAAKTLLTRHAMGFAGQTDATKQ